MIPKPSGKLAHQTSEEAPYPKPTLAWYVLGLLTLVYVFSLLGRTILSARGPSRVLHNIRGALRLAYARGGQEENPVVR